jgi:HAMP domain-containing protein
VLLLAEFAGMFYSSQTLLGGLTDLNRINTLSGHLGRADANFASLRETLDKAGSPAASGASMKVIYEKGFGQAVAALADARAVSAAPDGVGQLVVDASESLRNLNHVARRILSHPPAGTAEARESLSRDLLLAKQFEVEAEDALRRAQIILKTSGEKSFAVVYGGRYNALLFSFAVAISFFVLVALAGWSASRRLRRSLRGLLDATDRVARGDLSVRPPILYADEIGRLTSAFGTMAANLDRSLEESRVSAERTARLQSITADFSRAPEPKTVAEAVIQNGMKFLGAESAAVLVVSADGKHLDFLGSVGIADRVLENPVSLEERRPVTEALLSGPPLFVESRDEVAKKYRRLSVSDSRS